MRKRLLILLPTLLTAAALLGPAQSQAIITGIGDEDATAMFNSPYFQALHVHYVRYFLPYDDMESPYTQRLADQWLSAAQAAGAQPLIAFYHSEYHPRHLPSVAEYTTEIKKFMVAHPAVKLYTPWNEANHKGGARFANPTGKQAARFYLALRKVCVGCQIVGLDVLDTDPKSTVAYVKQFKKAVGHKLPKIWGLHNYTDTNRFHSTDTSQVIKAFGGGQTWLTETGGLVKFGSSFPNRHGSGLKRAAKAIKYMFGLTRKFHQIKRVYLYSWTSTPTDIFDAGLVDSNGNPRPGYQVVKDWLAGHPS